MTWHSHIEKTPPWTTVQKCVNASWRWPGGRNDFAIVRFPLSGGSEGSVCLLIHWGSESLLWNPSLLRERKSRGVAVTVSGIWSNLTAEERKSSVVSREDRMNGNEKTWRRFVETPAAEGDSLRTRDTGVGLRSVGVVARLTFTVTRTAVASAGPRRPTPGSWLPPWPSPTRPSRSPWAAAGASLLSAQRERERQEVPSAPTPPTRPRVVDKLWPRGPYADR